MKVYDPETGCLVDKEDIKLDKVTRAYVGIPVAFPVKQLMNCTEQSKSEQTYVDSSDDESDENYPKLQIIRSRKPNQDEGGKVNFILDTGSWEEEQNEYLRQQEEKYWDNDSKEEEIRQQKEEEYWESLNREEEERKQEEEDEERRTKFYDNLDY